MIKDSILFLIKTQRLNITHVFCLGEKSYKLYCKYRDSKDRSIVEAVRLISSSNTARSAKKDDELVDHYKEELKKVPAFINL